MKIQIVLILLISSAFAQNASFSLTECLTNEGLTQLTGSVYDVYNNIITFESFTEKFTDFITAENPLKCINTFAESVKNEDMSVLLKLGYTILLQANCSKTVGPALIVLDRAISAAKDIRNEWKDVLINGVMFGFITRQAYSDCSNAWVSIRDIWSKK